MKESRGQHPKHSLLKAMTTSTQANTTPYPWEKWSMLPKEEREAEMNEELKNANRIDNLRQYITNQGGDPNGPNLRPEYRQILSGASDIGIETNPYLNALADPLEWEFENKEKVDKPLIIEVIDLVKNGWSKWHDGNGFREGYLDISQPDSLTGEATDTENVGGNVSWMSPEDRKEVGLEFDQDCPALEFKFNSNPEILSPLNLDSALVTDAYQQQDAPGVDLIGSEANQGVDPYQAREGRYEVLA